MNWGRDGGWRLMCLWRWVSLLLFFSFFLFFHGTLTLLCFDVWAIIWKDAKRVEYQWEFVFNEIEHSTLSHNPSCLQR